jgi:hypothetical protein
MSATAATREWDVEEVIRLQDSLNPDTGRNWSLRQIKDKLEIPVTIAAMSKATRTVRHERQMGAPGIADDRLLPFTVPKHLDSNYVTRCLRLWVRRARGEELGVRELRRLASFEVFLGRMGRETVVGMDEKRGAYFFRQRRPYEATVYGVVLKPGAPKV